MSYETSKPSGAAPEMNVFLMVLHDVAVLVACCTWHLVGFALLYLFADVVHASAFG